jgi:hypothetical protein
VLNATTHRNNPAVIGGAVAAGVVVVILILFIWWLLRRRKDRISPRDPSHGTLSDVPRSMPGYSEEWRTSFAYPYLVSQPASSRRWSDGSSDQQSRSRSSMNSIDPPTTIGDCSPVPSRPAIGREVSEVSHSIEGDTPISGQTCPSWYVRTLQANSTQGIAEGNRDQTLGHSRFIGSSGRKATLQDAETTPFRPLRPPGVPRSVTDCATSRPSTPSGRVPPPALPDETWKTTRKHVQGRAQDFGPVPESPEHQMSPPDYSQVGDSHTLHDIAYHSNGPDLAGH